LIGGLVLAAGEGRRFGGSKLAAELGGRPLLDHAVEGMLAVPAIERVVVVLGAHAGEVAASAELTEVETVICDEWREGISASLRVGVRALADAEAIVLMLGDQPFITPQVIAAIADQVDAREPAARATYDGRPGHPVMIKRRLFGAIEELRGDAGARDLLAGAGVRCLECGDLCTPDDVDTRNDLEAARRRFGSGQARDGAGRRRPPGDDAGQRS
jgi:molybdenum cofactor cytidylyltransferase